ncbi:MAG: phosphate signaling complex PhoU family protein [Phycisphaerales bacterium]
MPLTVADFRERLDRLRADMAAQCVTAHALLENAVEAVFTADTALAAECSAQDDEIDRADVAIERAAVALLAEVASTAIAVPESDLRHILTVVKVNNEVERIADLATEIADETAGFAQLGARPPETFRVMANSVIGIVDAARRCFQGTDVRIAKILLESEDAVERFRRQLLRDTEQRLADRALTVDEGVALLSITANLARIADHSTNIAEQVIYAASGAIVRHGAQGWVESQPE